MTELASNIYELTKEQFTDTNVTVGQFVRTTKIQLDLLEKEYNESNGSMSSPAFDTLLDIIKRGDSVYQKMCTG